MEEGNKTNEVNKNVEGAGTPPAEGAKTEQNVPYERFQEVVKKKNEAESKLTQLLKEKEDAEKKTLEEQKKFGELYKKASEDLEQAKKKYEEESIKNSLIIEAGKHRIVDADAVYKLIDKSKLKLVDGRVENIGEAIEELIKEKPYLVSKEVNYPVTGVPPKGGEELSTDAISKMTMEQYAEWRKNNK